MIFHYNKIIIFSMKTVQKIIKIGTSYGVILPKKQLLEEGLGLGKKIHISTKSAETSKHDDLMRDYKLFVKQYGRTLKNLANR